MIASNNSDCFREFIGQKLKGILAHRHLTTLVFEDGRGLTISSNGSYWIDGTESILSALAQKIKELKTEQLNIKDMLYMAGENG